MGRKGDERENEGAGESAQPITRHVEEKRNEEKCNRGGGGQVWCTTLLLPVPPHGEHNEYYGPFLVAIC
jgi:hypothetical protein